MVEPHARELGSEAELAGIAEILRRGNGADGQLRVFNANRDIVEVVREIAVQTEGRGLSRRLSACSRCGATDPGRPRLDDAAGDAQARPELVADGPILLLFYLFDWSST